MKLSSPSPSPESAKSALATATATTKQSVDFIELTFINVSDNGMSPPAYEGHARHVSSVLGTFFPHASDQAPIGQLLEAHSSPDFQSARGVCALISAKSTNSAICRS